VEPPEVLTIMQVEHEGTRADTATPPMTTTKEELMQEADETETTAASESTTITETAPSSVLNHRIRDMDVICGRGKMAFHHSE